MNDLPQQPSPLPVEPGMVVVTTEADIGEADISKPVVQDVVRDETGNIEAITVKKGVLFTKEIEVPADRIIAVEPDSGQEDAPGKVIVHAIEEEVQTLAPSGMEPLRVEDRANSNNREGLVEQVERAVPTETGLRALEADAATQAGENQPAGPSLRSLGPGFLAGISGKDSSAVTTYAVDGARLGYSHLWLMLLATPLLHAVQFACAKIGRLQQQGFAEIAVQNYGLRVAAPAAFLLVVANVAMVAGNLVAVSTGLELISAVPWSWTILPVAVILWYITVYQDFNSLKKVFLIMSLAFFTYIVTAVMAQPDWGAVLKNTFVPDISFSIGSISAAVGLLGATISPYTLFWQMQGEKEEQRPGNRRQQLRTAGVDIASGVISSNLVAYAIIVSSSATLFVTHRPIGTALDAARAFEPLLGSAAKYLFAVGFIGAGLIAIPVLLASTSYAVAGTVGWPAGLSRKPWQSEGFYLIFTVALVVSLVVAVMGFDPIQLMFWANVLQGILTPFLVVLLLLIGNNREIMKGMPLNKLTNTGLALTAIIMFAGAGLLFYSFFAGA